MKFAQDFKKFNLSGKWHFVYSDVPIETNTIARIQESGLNILDATVPGNFELDLHAN